MDADDTLPDECGRAMHDVAGAAEDRTTGYLMQVRMPARPGDWGETVVDHVRIFRNLPELRFEDRIHEQIMEPIYRLGGVIGPEGYFARIGDATSVDDRHTRTDFGVHPDGGRSGTAGCIGIARESHAREVRE